MERVKGIELDDIFTDMVRKNHRQIISAERKRKADILVAIKKGIAITIGAAMMIAGCGYVGNQEIADSYMETREAIIIDSYSFVTKDGNEWKYDTEFDCGTKVKVLFNNNGTETVEDDIPINIRKY